MGWPEPVKNTKGKTVGYRGRYRDSDGNKQTVKDEAGNPKVFGRKSDAKVAANEQEPKARRKAAVIVGNPQLANMLWGDWWDQIVDKRQFPTTDTARKEASIVKLYLRPRWGDTPLNKIKQKVVKDWVEDLKAGRMTNWTSANPPSAAYVIKIWTVFSASINMALVGEEPILDASPCAAINNLPKVHKRQKPYIGHRAVKMLTEKGGLPGHYKDCVDFSLETGVRPGEMCGLHVSRIDFDRCWMLVADVLVERQFLIRPYTKNGETRWVPLTPKALEIIERRLDGRSRVGGCGVPHTDGSECDGAIVFLNSRGRPIRPEPYTSALKDAATAAGLPRSSYSAYGGRRGFATAAADGGLDAFALKGILGHATLDQVLEYVQQTPWARERLLVALGARPDGLSSTGPQLTVLQGGAPGAAPGAHSLQPMQDHAGSALARNQG